MSRVSKAVLLLSMLALGAQASLAATSTAPLLAHVVLKGGQIGPGYQLKLRPDSHGARGFVTLDFCGFRFPSESMRTDRFQVNYVHDGKVKLSNEVVTYKPLGAQLALREVANAATHCPHHAVKSTIAGVPPLTYRVTFVDARHLVPMHVALRMHVSGKVAGKPYSQTLYAIYQIQGNVLSGLYVYGDSPAVRRLALHAAVASAANLRRWA
jgi:hypothetical protein